MAEPLPLFEQPPESPKLGTRQKLVHDAIRERGHLTDTDAGLLIHLERGCRFCRPGEPCKFAVGEGRQVLSSLRVKLGLVRRRTGVWEFRDRRGVDAAGTADARPDDDPFEAARVYDPATAEIPF